MVNLATLAPDIIAAILDETLPEEVTLFELAAGTPLPRRRCRRRPVARLPDGQHQQHGISLLRSHAQGWPVSRI